jgi:hypothetical protein
MIRWAACYQVSDQTIHHLYLHRKPNSVGREGLS